MRKDMPRICDELIATVVCRDRTVTLIMASSLFKYCSAVSYVLRHCYAALDDVSLRSFYLAETIG